MWLLRNDSNGLLYRVYPGKQHIVTRKEGDLVLLGDQSISRKHAEIQIDEENGANGIIVKDLGSKYGTFTVIGGGELVQISPNQQVKLSSGDSVRFGVQWNCWRVEFINLLVATSTLSNEEKSDVKQMVEALEGSVASDWQPECSHLTMNKLTVTIKVVCALASGQPIVTPSFWKSFHESVSTMESSLPDCKDFLPPLAEAMLNPTEVSFAPNPARSKLFQGYTFVAASAKQRNRINPMITAAGGKAVEFSARTWTEDRLAEDDKAILMLSSPNERQGSQQSQVLDGYIPVARNLRSKGIRCIPESEIGLSVLHCSMAQFCNPRFNNQSLIKSPASGQATQQVTVICPNSEESMEADQENINTVPGPSVQPVKNKRALEDVNRNEEPLNKRPDLRTNSEDFFDSQQQLNNSRTNNLSKSSVNKTDCSNKPSLESPIRINPVPSLDMFAPSGERSSKKTDCSIKSSLESAVKITPAPSLDMFAPSGERSGSTNAHNQSAVNPSCEDMFASSSSSRQSLKRGSRDTASDKFSVPQRINNNVPADEEDDVFSFASTKNCKKSRIENVVDEFSFKPNRTLTHQTEENEKDEFSFSSVKKPNKRNRQSNPDMFASSIESSASDSFVKPSKSRDSGNFKSSNQNGCEDNLFAFPDDHNPKRKRTDNQVLDLNDLGGEVKIALLTNGSEPEPSRQLLQEHCEDLPEQKNLTIYSKFNNTSKNIKQEIEDEEMDELARELQNATVVMVKPLLVVRETPKQSSETHTGKNFKKFRKVVGINKRLIPHIIGGSDLVAHYNIGQDSRDKDPAPELNIPDEFDDEWTFNQNKRRNKF